MDINNLFVRFCEYSTFVKGYSPFTIKRYTHQVGYFFRYTNISHPSEVNHNMAYEFFLHGRTERHWKSTTYTAYLHSLIVFFRWCQKQGLIETNHFESIELPKKEKSLPKKLTQQQANYILEVSQNLPYQHHFQRVRNHAIFATFFHTGLRKSELLALNMVDVDIQNLSIFVRKGKGGKDRIIPISSTLAMHLTLYIKERSKRSKTCPSFFTSTRKNQGFTDSGLKKLTERVRQATGIHFTIHQLRHTFATLMLEGGCDIYSLSKMMGHSDIKTTTIYLSASPEHLRHQVIKHPLNH